MEEQQSHAPEGSAAAVPAPPPAVEIEAAPLGAEEAPPSAAQAAADASFDADAALAAQLAREEQAQVAMVQHRSRSGRVSKRVVVQVRDDAADNLNRAAHAELTSATCTQ